MTRSISVFVPSDARYANQYLVRQAKSLAATVVTRADQELQPLLAPCDVRLIGGTTALTRLASRGSLSCWRRLRIGPVDPINARRLRDAIDDADVAYTMFLPNAAELVASRRRARPPVVCHAAGSDVTTLPRLPEPARTWSLSAVERADLVLCGSEFLHDRLTRLARPRRATVHYIGVPVPPTPTDVSSVQSSRVRFIAVARLHPVKGTRSTIRSFAAGFGEGDDAELHIVGDGPERQAAESDVRRLGLQGRVVFHGEVSPARVEELLRASHVFVQHNRATADGAEEALGGSILEASAHGLPIVAARSGGVGEAVQDGRTGYLVESGDITAMADAMRALAESSQLRVRLGEAGRDFIRDRHDAEHQDARLAALLGDV